MLPLATVHRLEEIVGAKHVSTSAADLYTYGFDASIHHRSPDVVIRPHTNQEIQKIVCLANKDKIPLVPRGAGTALSGQAVPLKGGIVMDLTRMEVEVNA